MFGVFFLTAGGKFPKLKLFKITLINKSLKICKTV